MCSLSPQAAVGAKLEADERWSSSTKTYRQQVTCEVFGNKMKDICGATGTEGPHPFVVKKRYFLDCGAALSLADVLVYCIHDSASLLGILAECEQHRHWYLTGSAPRSPQG